ncbi:hypothetical protein, partial [Aerococcus urinae]
MGPKPAVDYSARYGVTVTNHYPDRPANGSNAGAWSGHRASSLDFFIKENWGRVMNQDYEAYT